MTSERLKRKPIVLHIITGLGDGGAEAVLYNLIRSAINFEHKIISLSGPGKIWTHDGSRRFRGLLP